jgi:hypothetical protein
LRCVVGALVGLQLGGQEDIMTQVQAEESWILINEKYDAYFAGR